MSEFQTARRASVWVLPVTAGGCGAAFQSILALQAPRYAAELKTRGVSFARSPRHADIILICGPLTQQADPPVRRLLDAVPQPRALIAVGNCAIDGCVFASSPQITADAADALDVHVEVTGCPPTPAAILAAIVEAKQLLAGAGDLEDDTEGQDDDTEMAEEDDKA